MRLSPVLWFAQETGSTPADPSVAEVAASCGDLRSDNFDLWWQQTGTHIFSERERLGAVTALALDDFDRHRFSADKLYVEVPLNIRRQTIMRQFKNILAASGHEGRQLNLAKHTTADFKLYTKRYNMKALETRYFVMIYRLIYPNIEIWKIGDRLLIASHLRVSERGDELFVKNANALNALTGRYYYKGRFSILNAERGNFPNTNALVLDDQVAVFGEKVQADYIAATKMSGGNPEESPWAAYLIKNFASDIKWEVARRNRIDSLLSPGTFKSRKAVDEYVSGKSNIISL